MLVITLITNEKYIYSYRMLEKLMSMSEREKLYFQWVESSLGVDMYLLDR
jgi:hypothetical protein